jgi:aminoglycoside phosphotransferase (APT) family kinase protein
MHEGEVATDPALVGRLLAAQFPELAGRPIRAVRSTGTVNAIYRIGDDLCARLPRVAAGAGDLDREWQWLPRLAPALTLPIPEPVALGTATVEYSYAWAVYRWLAGEPYTDERIDDETAAAIELARFVSGLRGLAVPTEAPRGGRRPLPELDEVTRAALAASDVDDVPAAQDAWRRALEAPAWSGERVWLHGDLLRPNLLVAGGRLHAVIDFGGVGAGDPAADVVAAWAVFGPRGRAAYREALGVDDGTWERARGYALHQAALIVPYYRETNPAFAALGERTIAQVLASLDRGP